MSQATPFVTCTLCVEEGCEPCAFCTPECLRAAAPRHREFHREKRRLYTLAEQVAARHWYSAVGAAAITSPYDDLLTAAGSMAIGSTGVSQPADPPPLLSDVQQAAHEYILAVERSTPAASSGSVLHWAERVVAAYALCSNRNELAQMPRPTWWNDEALKAMSHLVLEARPDYVLAWRLRGEVLSALLGEASWPAAARTAAELQEAGRCLQRAASFGNELGDEADKVHVVRQAVACLRAAQGAAEAERQAQQAGLHSSAPSEASGGSHSCEHSFAQNLAPLQTSLHLQVEADAPARWQ